MRHSNVDLFFIFTLSRHNNTPTYSSTPTYYRVAKTHRMPYLYRSFSAKEPYIRWLFCETWPATEGILWVFHPVLRLVIWVKPFRIWGGVATISRLLGIIGLFRKRALQKRRYCAKKTCHFKEPTNRRHRIECNQRWSDETFMDWSASILI